MRYMYMYPCASMLVIIQLGSTNDADGRLDADAAVRALRTLEIHTDAVAAGRNVRVLTSGGTDTKFAFNPTETPHWTYVSELLLSMGLPRGALITPGLSALHTVDEAILAHRWVSATRHESVDASALQTAGTGIDSPSPVVGPVEEVVVVTSDYHAARARHLFGVAFGAHASLPVTANVVSVPGCLHGAELDARDAHEERSLLALRHSPHGVWLDFVRERRLEACNRSRRHSRRMEEPRRRGAGSIAESDMSLRCNAMPRAGMAPPGAADTLAGVPLGLSVAMGKSSSLQTASANSTLPSPGTLPGAPSVATMSDEEVNAALQAAMEADEHAVLLPPIHAPLAGQPAHLPPAAPSVADLSDEAVNAALQAAMDGEQLPVLQPFSPAQQSISQPTSMAYLSLPAAEAEALSQRMLLAMMGGDDLNVDQDDALASAQ